MTNITNETANKWLLDIQNVWLSLHISDPDTNGGLASEVQGGSYERVSAAFSTPDQRVIWNKYDAVFRGMPDTTISFIAGWDVQYNGVMKWYLPMTDPERVIAGQKFVIQAGEIAVSIA